MAVLGPLRHRLLPRTTLTRQAFVSCVPAPGSTASMVRTFVDGPVESPLNPQL